MSDLISRQDAIDYIDLITNIGLGKKKSLDYIRKYIERMDSARPTDIAAAYTSGYVEGSVNEALKARPKGEWIVEHDGNGWNDWESLICPVCGEKFEKVVNRRKYKFCSHCGADMRGEDE